MSAEDNEAGDGDEDQRQELHNTNAVGEPEAQLGVEKDKQRGDGVSSRSDTFRFPRGSGASGHCEEIVGKYDGVRAAECQDHGLEGVDGREEELWAWVRLFKIGDFGSRTTGEECGIFKVDGQSSGSE